jgi:hypothetical protein
VTIYRHTQFGTITVLVLAAGISLVVVISARVGWHPVSTVVGGILGLGLMLFHSLTIEVDRRRVRCAFGPGIISRQVPLVEIAAARPVRNRWYWGWGIRLTPAGWMFNVSGLDAVELELVQGGRFRIGTDEPELVVRAIAQAKELGTA